MHQLSALPSATVPIIQAAVAALIDGRYIFTNGQVTEAVKAKGGEGRWRDMAPVIRALYDQDRMPGYDQLEVELTDPKSGRRVQCKAYAPAGTDDATVAQFVSNAWVEASLPVEVRAAQAAGTLPAQTGPGGAQTAAQVQGAVAANPQLALPPAGKTGIGALGAHVLGRIRGMLGPGQGDQGGAA